MPMGAGNPSLSAAPSMENHDIISLENIEDRLALLLVDFDGSNNVRFNTPVVVRSTNTETLGAGKTLTGSDSEVQFLDGAADRTIVLPAESTSDGRKFTIVNTGNALELITVNDDGGTQKALLGPGMSTTLVCDGTTWFPIAGSTMNMQTSVTIKGLANTEEVLTNDSADIQVLDPGGGHTDVLLPTEATSIGRIFFITNSADAAENLIVKEDGDSTTIVTIAQNEVGIVWCDGTAWDGGVMAVT